MGESFKTRRGSNFVNIEFDNYNPTQSRLDYLATNLSSLYIGVSNIIAGNDGDSNVYFAGGFYGVYPWDPVDYVYRYDSNGVQMVVAGLNNAAVDCAAGTDGNGNILISGGAFSVMGTGSHYTDVNRYDLSGVKTMLTSLTSGRKSHQGQGNGAGNVLFGGGINGYSVTATVNKYTISGVRTSLTALSSARCNFASAGNGNGAAIFAGGFPGGQSDKFATVESYSTSDVRTLLTPLDVAVIAFGGCMDGEGNSFFGGGSSTKFVNRYATDGTKTTMPELSATFPSARATHDREGGVAFFSSSGLVNRYDLDGTRTVGRSLSSSNSEKAVATDANGNILITGGQFTASDYEERVICYKLATLTDLLVTKGSIYNLGPNDQEITATAQVITVPAPVNGYIKMKAGTIS